MVERGSVWLANLDPVVGSEIRKTRPCLVVSPTELNKHLRTVIVAPMTTGTTAVPFRIPLEFRGKRGFVAVDQLRAIDKHRLVRPLGKTPGETLVTVLATLQEMFGA